MKRCPNPNCESGFLFGNDKVTCPFCHTRLVDNTTVSTNQSLAIVPPDMIPIRETSNEPEVQETVFLTKHLGTIECHGRVTEIDHHEVFTGKWHKLFNTLLRGEPYQFAHQTIEYTIRVENIFDGFPTEVIDFCLFGSYLGRLQVGDEVVIRARDLSDRRIVKSIYNETTHTPVKPGFQIPSFIMRSVFLILAVTITAFICSIVWTFDSGMSDGAVADFLATLILIAIVLIGLRIMISGIFHRRRRR